MELYQYIKRQRDGYHPQGAKTLAIPVTATETSAMHSVASTVAIENCQSRGRWPAGEPKESLLKGRFLLGPCS